MLRYLATPVFYALELTPACNNRCPGCSNGFNARQWGGADCAVSAPLRADAWRRILAAIAPHAQRLKLTGGEPTLHPDFEPIVAAIEGHGVDFTLFTNGRWQYPLELLAFLQRCEHLTGLLVSLHGATAAAHEAFSGVAGTFAETLANVQRAVAAGIPVAFSVVLTTHNLNELPALVTLAEQYGVRTVVFNRYLGAPIPALTLTDTELRQAVAEIETLRRAGHPVKYGNCIPQCFTSNGSRGCLAGVAYCAIDPWGNLRPCTLSSWRAGNLLAAPLEVLWQGPVMERFRAAIPAACHECAAFALCHGGCRALALELGVAADPLAQPGIAVTLPAPEAVTLNPVWRPIARYTLRPQPWGLVLLHGNQLLPLRQEAQPLLDALDGQSTVAELHAQFGPPALTLMGALLQHHMLTFDL